MIGVFDSGAGGLGAISEIRKIAPKIDICFFADRKNAPYGTKSRSELIELVKADISILKDFGADRILMACCTASTVYRFLPEDMRKISNPIIEPAVKAASRVTKSGRIGVIATEATVASHAFRNSLASCKNINEIHELPTQKLVSLVEGGVKDGRVGSAEREIIHRILSPLYEKDIDTLILGCTHFPHLEKEIGRCFPNVTLINPSREGAKELLSNIHDTGRGKTIYL